MQVTNTVLMIPPDHFKYNTETAKTNKFQTPITEQNSNQQALLCFERFVALLEKNRINVLLLKNNPDINTPDAVFPNNWFSIQRINNQLTLILYPMLEPNRRAERRQNDLVALLNYHNIHIDKIIDLTRFEMENKALEGTGSIVFDHDNHILYVSLSPRSNREVLNKLMAEIHYQPITFTSYDMNGDEIYHTNVMMSVGKDFAVICKECIRDDEEQNKVLHSLKKSGKTIISISIEQVHRMAGNILELQSQDGSHLLAMSTQAYQAYSEEQRQLLQQYAKIIHSDLNIIETIGGGSARCMMAEVFK